MVNVTGDIGHNLLDGNVHVDTAADTVSKGSLVVGNSTPEWDELTVGATNTFLGSAGGGALWRIIQGQHVGGLTADRALQSSATGYVEISAVTDTELGYVSGVSSAIQTQLNARLTASGALNDNHLVRVDAGTAKTIQDDTNVILNDTDDISGVRYLDCDELRHDGDTDTRVYFGGDIVHFDAGGVEFLRMTEVVGQDAMYFNPGGVDIDLWWYSANASPLLKLDAGADTLTVNTDKKFLLRDANQYVHSSAADTLDLSANTTLNLRVAGTIVATVTATKLEVAGHVGIAVAPDADYLLKVSDTSSTLTGGIRGQLIQEGTIQSVLGLGYSVIRSGNTAAATGYVYGAVMTVDLAVNVTAGKTVDMLGLFAMVQTSIVQTNASTIVLYGLYGKASGRPFKGNHTDGDFYIVSVYGAAPIAAVGTPNSSTEWAGLFDGDLQINSDNKLIFEGSDTVKGDTYTIYDSGNATLDTFVGGVEICNLSDAEFNVLKPLNVGDPDVEAAWGWANFRLLKSGSGAEALNVTYDNAASSTQSCARARGTLGAPAAVQSSDELFAFSAVGYDGAAWRWPGKFIFKVDGAVSSGVVPTRFEIWTGTNSAPTLAFTVDSAQDAHLLTNGKLYVGAADDVSLGFDGTNMLLNAQDLAATSFLVITSVKTTTGDPAAVEGLLYWNTFDNKIQMYADGRWRTLASW